MNRTTLTRRGALAALWIAAAALLGASAGPAAAQTTLERIKKDGVLKVANSGVYPPFEFKEGDKLVGFDIDLSNMVAKALGVKAEITVVDFKGLIPTLKSGKADLLITAYTYTPERAEQVAFSEPYYKTAIAIAMRKDRPAAKTKAERAHLTIGAKLGTTGDREARSVKDVKEVKTYDTLMLAMRDLEIGRVDAVISTLPPLQYLIHTNFADIRVVGTYNAGWVGINARKEDTALLAAVNDIIKHLKSNGELKALEVKWFGEVGK